MSPYLVAYLSTLIVFLTLDAVWLGLVARGFYARQMGDLLANPPNLAIAAGFYAVYVVGIVLFALLPAFQSGGGRTALIHGAAFGFFAYATYNFTNMATIRGWPTAMSMVDLAWGTALTGTAAFAGYHLTRWLS